MPIKKRRQFNPVIPPELLVGGKIARPNPLTTDIIVTPRAESVPITQRTASAPTPMNVAQWRSDAAAITGGPGQIPEAISIGGGFNPVVGVYILAAPTGSGKTVLSMALTAWCNSEGFPASYVYCFEPRAPEWSYSGRKVFADPKKFSDDVKSTTQDNTKPKLVVYDSATLPLKANADKYKGQSTFQGGMQPSDRGFLDALDKIATAKRACYILVVNSTLVPYVSDLAGGAEGLIKILDVARFQFMDRTESSKRKFKEVVIPTPFVDAALDYFGFGTYNRGRTKTTNRGYSGI